MDTDDASAGGTGPLPPLALQESIHPGFPDGPQILQRGFAERVLRPVPGFLFHDVSAGGTMGTTLFVPLFCVATACMVYCFRVISMPRIARKKSISNIYHVMIRGINRQNIFEEDEDRLC